MTDWTITMLQDRLEIAADVMHQMPSVKPQGHFNAWPEYFHSFADKVGQEPKMRRPLPSPRMITQADEAMLWLRWLEVEDAKLLWLRAERTAWKPICWQFGVSRTAATRRWQYGLAVIVWRLNGRVPPTKRSMAYVIGRAKSPVGILNSHQMGSGSRCQDQPHPPRCGLPASARSPWP